MGERVYYHLTFCFDSSISSAIHQFTHYSNVPPRNIRSAMQPSFQNEQNRIVQYSKILCLDSNTVKENSHQKLSVCSMIELLLKAFFNFFVCVTLVFPKPGR